MKDWVTLAVIAQPHGVSGRVKVKSFTDPLDAFAAHAMLTDDQGIPVKLKLTGHAQGMPVVAIDGVTRREQAELLRGRKLGVARAAMPELPKPNQFYTDDLIGMAVVDAAGATVGTVHHVVNYGAGDILEIDHQGRMELYSFTHATFPTIDLKARRITFHPPEIMKPENGQG